MELDKTLEKLKSDAPLVHAITNNVTVNDCANITLAIGASPAMCESTEEVYDFVSLSKALYVNVGTLTGEQQKAIEIAVSRASEIGVPVVLDPVGAVALKNRQKLILNLLTKYNIACLKGNISEIKCLTGRSTEAKGVDSLDHGEDALEAAKELSLEYDTTVVATGKTDFIAQKNKSYSVDNGSPLLGRITGSGCMLGIITAAFLGTTKDNDNIQACLAGTTAMGIAGEKAQKHLQSENDLGTFRIKLFDSMASLRGEELKSRAKYQKL